MTELLEPPETVDIGEIEERLAETQINAAGNRGLVVGSVAGDLLVQVDRLRRMERLDPEYVRATVAAYVDRSFRTVAGQELRTDQVVERLRAHHSVVLLGEPGSGRHTAAVTALGRLNVPLERIPAWDAGQPGQFLAADLPAKAGTGYLFVHPDDETTSGEFGRQLRAYRDRLAAKGAFLVVVAREVAWRATGESWPDLTFAACIPDRRQLLAARVSARRPGRDLSRMIGDERVEELMCKASPRDVARLADLMVDTAGRAEAGQDDDWIVGEVVGAYQEWTHELDDWFGKHPDVDARLFLLAAAVLESSPAGRVLRCAEELAEMLEGRQVGRNSVTTAGVRQLAKAIDARLEGDDARLYFNRPSYAESVVEYFLTDRSDGFRRVFTDWLIQVPKVPGQYEATQLAQLVAGAVLGVVRRRSDIGLVLRIANRWALSGLLRPVLASLVTAVALSPEAGARMRARLNQWATYSASIDVWRLVAEVCTGDLADAYPQVALTRVKNLAVRADGPLVPLVVQAVIDLWQRPALQRDVLERLLQWLGDPAAPAFTVAGRVVATLGTATIRVAYEQNAGLGPALPAAVGNLLEHLDEPEHLRDTLYSWLDQAVDDEHFAGWLIEVLAASVRGPGSALRITCVRTFAYGWETRAVSSRRAALRERLVDRVSNANATILGWVRAVQPEGDGDA
ncbi:hypothetical protein C6361_34120 [Plantactinospora sp. BC1]|uniref:hypothetical protein n=1 Tax=Plantactinospora sp. BC1 TaxID=2108470 RepID=UPI000D167AB3|nr:hypothetical protein [Plantactinospora sp. BC1]AVT33651.1 hypothetical protein C6361_34120 [Plantactinospora sp. BC1]